jgi:molybdopterin/thiamine biosynthesis adenylyltransferase
MRFEDRYDRQQLFREIGKAGQTRIGEASIAIVGLGALGTIEASLLARAGVGRLRLIDRDFVESSNLQRQVLFDEADAAAGMPKADAAKRHLEAANSDVALEARAVELNPGNVAELLGDVDVVVDGSDNFEVRYLINDHQVRGGKPWVYAAAVGATGLLMPVLPGTTPCLRCVFEEPPPPGAADTCDTAGVLGPTTATVGALAALEALKIVAGRRDAVRRGLLQLELWSNDLRDVPLTAPREDCPCCGGRAFPFLAAAGRATTSLCGRDAVQVLPTRAGFDYAAVRTRVKQARTVEDNGFLIRFADGDLRVTLFRDGRAIVKGTTDAATARSLYDRVIGS